MTTAHQQTIAFSAESAFGSLVGNTPDVSGLTFVAVEAERIEGDGITPGALPVNERGDVRAHPGALPPEPAVAWVGGAPLRSRKGELAVSFVLRGVGNGSGAIDTYAASLLGALLRSVGEVSLASEAGTTVTARTDSTLTVANRNVASIGALIAINEAGRRHYAVVTDIEETAGTTGVLTIHPEFAGVDALTTAATVRGCATYYVANTLAKGPSLAFRIDTRGTRSIITGARLQSLALSVEGNRVMVAATIRFAHCGDDHSSAAVLNPSRSQGTPAHLLGACSVASGSLINASAPVSGLRNALPVSGNGFALSLAWTLAEVGSPCSALGMSDLEPTGLEATATLPLDTLASTFDGDALQKTVRTYLMAFGPGVDGSGFVACFAAGHQTTDGSLRDGSGDIIRRMLAVQAGGPAVESDASTALATSIARIGLVL